MRGGRDEDSEPLRDLLDRGEAAVPLGADGLEATRGLAELRPDHAIAHLAADPHVALRDMLIELPRDDGGRPVLVVGNPIKLSQAAEGPVARFPSLGQHTDATLREDLGLAQTEIDALRAKGAIG